MKEKQVAVSRRKYNATFKEEELVIEALWLALGTRTAAQGLMVHSYQGGQYAGNTFRRLLDRHKVRQSMSRGDNAFMESGSRPLQDPSAQGRCL